MFVENDEVIRAFLRVASTKQIEDPEVQTALNFSVEIIELINGNASDWDKECQFNIKYIGENFISELRNFGTGKDIQREINSILDSSYRFLLEYDFNRFRLGSSSIEIRSLKSRIRTQKMGSLGGDQLSQFIYASYEMPADMMKEWLSNPDIVAFKKFEQSVEKATKLYGDWDKEFSTKEARITELKKKLDEYQTGFNFVGLHQGFSNLANKKIRESRTLSHLLFVIGFLILLPICSELVFVLLKIFSGEVMDLNHLIFLIPLISLEIILIYFFRVVLLNYRSVKAQILQIELRQTLCEFIQSYADYSSAIKKKDAEVLNKFENLIFSGVLSDPEKLPSTFDGLEQIATIIKNIKSTS